jgi:hypothetical protein
MPIHGATYLVLRPPMLDAAVDKSHTTNIERKAAVALCLTVIVGPKSQAPIISFLPSPKSRIANTMR